MAFSHEFLPKITDSILRGDIFMASAYTKPVRICEMCGTQQVMEDFLCNICQQTLLRPIFKELVKGRIAEGDTTYCKRCLTHKNSCSCPERKVLEAINAEPTLKDTYYQAWQQYQMLLSYGVITKEDLKNVI